MAHAGTPAKKGVAEVNSEDDKEVNNHLRHRLLLMF